MSISREDIEALRQNVVQDAYGIGYLAALDAVLALGVCPDCGGFTTDDIPRIQGKFAHATRCETGGENWKCWREKDHTGIHQGVGIPPCPNPVHQGDREALVITRNPDGTWSDEKARLLARILRDQAEIVSNDEKVPAVGGIFYEWATDIFDALRAADGGNR